MLGYAPSQILRIFSTESLLLNGLGIGIGTLGGVGLSYLLSAAYNTELYRFPVVIVPRYLLFSALLMAGFILAAQVVVLRLIQTLKWLDTLKARE